MIVTSNEHARLWLSYAFVISVALGIVANVQKIVQAHGGRISVRSQPGHGTTFVFHLPLPSEQK